MRSPTTKRRLDARRPSSPLDGTDGSGTGGFRVAKEDSAPDGVAILTVRGELDGHTAPQLKAALVAAMHQGETAIMIDLEACPFIDSTGLAVLCGVARMLRAPNGSPGLAAISTQPQVARVFGVSHVDEAVPLRSGRLEALATLGRA